MKMTASPLKQASVECSKTSFKLGWTVVAA